MRFIFFDVETQILEETKKDVTQGFRLLTANLVNYRKSGSFRIVERFRTNVKEEFFLWLLDKLQKKKIMYILSANIWFDIRNSGLFLFLMDNHWKETMFYQKSLTCIIKISRGPFTIIFLNMQQFIPVGVEAYGYMIGLYKMDLNPFWWNEKDVFEYCQRDTDIITEVFKQWLDFIRVNRLGRMAFTVASQSFTAYRYRFLSKKIYIHNHDWLTDLERKCYHGGRTDIFFQGNIKDQVIYNLDINSMYPYVMKKHRMPVKAVKMLKLPSLITVRAYSLIYNIIGFCAINTDEPAYLKVIKNRCCFPVGKFTCYLTDPEIRYAIRKGHLVSVYYLACYEKEYIFGDYVDFFHALKSKYGDEGNKTYRQISKLFMNSLYGKFGQKIDVQYFTDTLQSPEYSQETVYDADTNIVYKELRLGFQRRVFQEAAASGYNSFPAIASHVTGLARMYLWKLIKKAGDRNVFYCDTDSLFVSEQGYQNLSKYIDEDKLGKLGLKDKSFDTTIYCPKDYIFNEKATIKGVKKASRQNEDGSFSILVFPSFRSDMKAGLRQPYKIRKVNKTLKRIYTKGEVLPDGWVKPFALEDF